MDVLVNAAGQNIFPFRVNDFVRLHFKAFPDCMNRISFD
jgi:hypothetical protein